VEGRRFDRLLAVVVPRACACVCWVAVSVVPMGCRAEGGKTDTAENVAPIEREGQMIKEQRSGEWTPGLTDAEKATLFAIAEDTLKACVAGKKVNLSTYALTDKLREQAATFVTLNKHGRLRGCIGSLTPVAPLFQSVHDNAVHAALEDYRFRPVTAAEVPELEIHVSILSPIVPIDALDEFRIGEHGIIIEKRDRRAVYLPEVAVEQHWDKATTLTSLSEKAGLPGDAWREGASFKVFSSVVLTR